MKTMEIKVIADELSVCKVEDYSQVDFGKEYTFTGKTDEENSLVCPSDAVPENVLERDDGWRAFRIKGVLDFSLIGVLAKISALLADAGIGIFVVSTYNTDYVLTKTKQFVQALDVLKAGGYEVLSGKRPYVSNLIPANK